MLSIECVDVEEQVTMGDLFNAIEFSDAVLSSDLTGDSYIENSWGIEVLAPGGYYLIEGFRWTKPEQQVVLTLQEPISGKMLSLQCSPEHVVLQQKPDIWQKIGELTVEDCVETRFGQYHVRTIEPILNIDRLCDIQVSVVHSYYANDVASHNSHFLVWLGCQAMLSGINVLHYTFELSEAATGLRYDSMLCDIDSNDLFEHKAQVIERYQTAKSMGRLQIKEFPANTATIYTLRAHVEALEIRENFKPGLLIVDYADIMRSTRQYDSLRHELKLVYEELRSFAQEKKFPAWTASQSNRDGSNQDIVDLTNMSEAYGKAFVADVILSISRRSHEKSTGEGRLYVAKNRAGRDGLVYPMMIDTARSKFAVSGVATGFEAASADDEAQKKRLIREKWQQLKNDPLFNGTPTTVVASLGNIDMGATAPMVGASAVPTATLLHSLGTRSI